MGGDAIQRVWKLLSDQDCLPYMARIQDISPGDDPLTDIEAEQLRVADQEAEQKNRAFCRRVVEAATEFKVSSVGPSNYDRLLRAAKEWRQATESRLRLLDSRGEAAKAMLKPDADFIAVIEELTKGTK